MKKAWTLTELITYAIQHDEYFPDVDTMDLASAQEFIDSLDLRDPSQQFPPLTAQEVMDEWNRLIEDDAVMSLD